MAHPDASREMVGPQVSDPTYAPPTVRDEFLDALARGDAARLAELAPNLTGCGNPLPSGTCAELGIPVGSTYGTAARHIIAR